MGLFSFNSNIFSLRAQRQLGLASDALARSSARLSSGQRINRASDDAAGLAISSALNKDVRVYTQAIRNGNDAISALGVAEGTLTQLSSVLTRMRELAVQSANGTFSRTQRLSTDAEALQLQKEFNRLVESTEFNGIRMLDGRFGRMNIQLGYGTSGSIGFGVGEDLSRRIGTGFNSVQTYAGGGTSGANDSVTADFDGDGKLDLVTNYSGFGSGVYFLKGNGNGSFMAAVDTGITPGETLSASDINGDGRQDLVLGNGFGVGVAFGNGNGTFSEGPDSLVGNFQSTLKLIDINGDGRLDVLGGRANNSSIFVALGDGAGNFSNAYTLTHSTARFAEFEVGDINNDGKVDLLASDTQAGSGMFVRFGNGDGTFGNFSTVLTGGGTNSFELIDLNYDGMLDIVRTDNTLSSAQVLFGNGNGTFSTGQSVSTLAGAYELLARDQDGDGLVDLVVSNDSGVSVYKGNGDGTFGVASLLATTADSDRNLMMGDFNGDGVTDIGVTLNGAGGTGIFIASSVSTTALQRLNLTTRQEALNSLTVIDAAMERVAKELGTLGSAQSRVESALRTLSASQENSAAAASRIQDIDVASESSHYVQKQILLQTTSAVLAQANLIPELALRLLRN